MTAVLDGAGDAGRVALEMATAAYDSHFRGERVTLPLESRPVEKSPC